MANEMIEARIMRSSFYCTTATYEPDVLPLVPFSKGTPNQKNKMVSIFIN